MILDSFLASKIKNAEIYEIKDFEDHLLIATNKGVYKYKPFTKDFKSISGLENKYARYIKIINKNSFWVGCYGDGLYLVQNNKAFKVNDKNIKLSTAHAVEEGKKENLWITTNDGLLVVNKNEVISKTLKNDFIECYRYTVEDGFATNEFNGGCTHPSFKDTDGLFGFPSIKGIVWFNPEKTQQYAFSGKIIIDEVKADEKVINLKNNSFTIPSKTALLSINFSYPYYFNRENLSVEYRFKNSDKWIKILGDNFKIVRSKKGRHELLMRIRTHGNLDKNMLTQSFRFDFEPRTYETGWFLGLLVALLFLLFLLMFQIGTTLQKKRAVELQNKIDEKTVILKETVLELENSKNAVTASLHEKEILLKEIHHRVKNNLQLVISMMSVQALRDNYKNIDDFIETTRIRIASMIIIHQSLYQGPSLAEVDVDSYIKMFIKELSFSFTSSKNVSITSSTNNITFNISIAIPFGLIVNEIMTNALKHAFPDNRKGNIKINLERINDLNILTIEDNGIGFKPANTQQNSFGLDLISLLVRQLKGTRILESENGTKYSITFADVIEERPDFT